MATRSVLGVPQVRPPFLDDVSPARPRQGQACDRRRAGARSLVKSRRGVPCARSYDFGVTVFSLQDIDDPDEEDEDDDEDDTENDDDDDDDEDDEEDDEEEEETWQVAGPRFTLTHHLRLTSAGKPA